MQDPRTLIPRPRSLTGTGTGESAILFREYAPDQFKNVGASDAVTAIAQLADDTNAAEHHVRLFDPATDEAVSIPVMVPEQATGVRIWLQARPETTPAGAVASYWSAYGMSITTTAGAWSSEVALGHISHGANENYETCQSDIIPLATLNLTQGSPGLINLARDASNGSDDLLSDAAMCMAAVEFV